MITIFLLLMTGCQSHPSRDIVLDKLKNLYPENLLTSVKEGEFTEKENSLSLFCSDLSLRLDLVYKKGKLIQFVCKDYGFVEGLDDVNFDIDKAKNQITEFQNLFLNHSVTIALTDPVSGYESNEYQTFIDDNNAIYLFSLKKGILLKYFHS